MADFISWLFRSGQTTSRQIQTPVKGEQKSTGINRSSVVSSKSNGNTSGRRSVRPDKKPACDSPSTTHTQPHRDDPPIYETLPQSNADIATKVPVSPPSASADHPDVDPLMLALAMARKLPCSRRYVIKSRFVGQIKFACDSWFAPGHQFGDACEFRERCIFGDGCSFGDGCTFASNCKFGSTSRFGSGTVFESRCAFGGGCVIGVSSTIGPSSVFSGRSAIGSSSIIGRESTFFGYTSIGSNTDIGQACHFSGRSVIEPDCKIGDSCNFGGNTIVKPGGTIGFDVYFERQISISRGCFVGGSILRHDMDISHASSNQEPESAVWANYDSDNSLNRHLNVSYHQSNPSLRVWTTKSECPTDSFRAETWCKVPPNSEICRKYQAYDRDKRLLFQLERRLGFSDRTASIVFNSTQGQNSLYLGAARVVNLESGTTISVLERTGRDCMSVRSDADGSVTVIGPSGARTVFTKLGNTILYKGAVFYNNGPQLFQLDPC